MHNETVVANGLMLSKVVPQGWAREMAQGLREYVVLAEGPEFGSCTHMVARNFL